MPKWTGKALAAFPSIPSCLSPTISPRASPVATGPLTMGGGSHLVSEHLPIPQPPLRGAGTGGPAFTFAPPSPPPTPSRPVHLEGALVGRGSGLGSQQRFLGAQVGRGNLAMLPVDPLPSQLFPSFPLQAWDPFPSPSCPSGAPVPSCLHFSSPFTPLTPHILPGGWGFLLSP